MKTTSPTDNDTYRFPTPSDGQILDTSNYGVSSQHLDVAPDESASAEDWLLWAEEIAQPGNHVPDFGVVTDPARNEAAEAMAREVGSGVVAAAEQILRDSATPDYLDMAAPQLLINYGSWLNHFRKDR